MIRSCLALSFLALLPVRAAENWDVVRVGRVDYVTLTSFLKFYNMKGPGEIDPQRSFDVTGPAGSMNMNVDSREMRWKGARYWLSHPIRQVNGVTLIPRVDLVKTFDPLLRPNVEIPRQPLQGVVVDPGHGGGDQGTRAARGLNEKDANFDVSRRLVRLLEKEGIPWVLTRNKDIYVDHGDRSRKASDRPGYIFVSIHFNEDSDRDTTGWETYTLSPQYAPSTSSGGTLIGDEDEIWPGNQFDHQNFLLGQAIHRAAVLAKSNAPSDRGLKRARFKVLRLARSPSVLVEGGFMSNPREAALLKTEAYRQQVAQWVFEGIQAYKRSQESPEEAARLKLAIQTHASNVPTVTGANLPIPKLEDVPNFRPKSDSSSVTTTAPKPTTSKNSVTPETSIPDFRSKTNPPVAEAQSATPPPPFAAGAREPEVRKAEKAEPEVRRAIPVSPRRAE
ncbi:MAG: N-acetylmuramoyl-L-alanine amidase [Verrucomicrobia bacterium]|nr:N-acetylmuramoyl-L-alanine amidase [Verrucomicrobiota bacterium]